MEPYARGNCRCCYGGIRRERDQCPMHFDTDTNPWLDTEHTIQVFDFGFFKSGAVTARTSVVGVILGSCVTFSSYLWWIK
ncbi:hypothetical protein NQ317_002384 [Molorchus minor]|uniref:Uncharacterized protein n=1 Tax=Molorchus minor TaxID=1323400 RepID=A0ABQ9J865_9CUCU|nr:hypothetical protein NQ317_002384 [Molorchus minor]